MRVRFVHLTDFSVRPPPEIAGSRVPQISVRNRFEAERRIEISRKLVGESLVVNEAVVASRSNSLLVKTHGVGLAPFEARNLGAHQRCPICEILGTMSRPRLKLQMVSIKRIPAGRSRIAWRRGRGSREGGIEMVFRHLEERR